MGLMKEAFRRVRLMFAETKTNQAPFIRQSLKKKNMKQVLCLSFSVSISAGLSASLIKATDYVKRKTRLKL